MTPVASSATSDVPSWVEKILPPSGNIPDGLRMAGTYEGPGGANIEFQPDKALVGCHATIAAHPYSVNFKGGKVLIDLEGNGTAQAFDLRRDGVLAGSGATITIFGKRKTGENVLGEDTYVQSSDTCTYGNLTPRGQDRSSENPPLSNVPPRNTPTSNAVTPPVPRNTPSANTTASPIEPTVLNVSSSFAGQASNPLSGRELLVINQSWEDVLRKAGFQDLPAAAVKRSAIAIWAEACKTPTPRCKQGIDAMQGFYVGKIRLDPTGTVSASGMSIGTYWIVGLGAANNQHYVWNLRIDIKPGPNSIVFDPRNAAIIY